jgi:hypothetical protein
MAEDGQPEINREDLLQQWNDEKLTFEQRDALMGRLEGLNLYPRLMQESDAWESEGGLYPDTEDPRFTEKLMEKQEFAENKQESILEQAAAGVNPCDPDKEFELTPVQRFVGRFLSPQCPYLSALLFHGVGVGKTCAAITIAENYLRSFPRKPVYIVAPRNIQPGFRRTIFDDESLIIPDDTDTINTAKGCTGNTYLKRTGTEFERERGTILRRVAQAITSRYIFLGYIQFNRVIEDIIKRVPKGLDEADAKAQRDKLLRREFSGRAVIIDEAHNLRDNPAESADDAADNPGGDAELTEAQAGKRLTPNLIKVLNAAEGMKLVLLSGTPMYNSYREIVFLLNLLLMNDKKATLSERDIFLPTGAFKKAAAPGQKGGEELLGAAANAYVSFMRGENPLSFPVRLPPIGTPPLTAWPSLAPDAKEIPENQKERMLRLPFVPVEYEGASKEAYQRISEEAIEGGGMGVGSIDEMVQSGNWLFPAEGGPQIRDMGFDGCFDEKNGGTQFTARGGAPTWLQRDEIGAASAKAKFMLDRAQTAKGVIFVYSRFIKSGALPLALALEANGYSPWGDRKPLLTNGIVGDQGRQCALCPRRERAHAGAGHKFVAAKYILITGRATISPNNPAAIQAARVKTNMDGREIKVIIGSQVASEGVDFRFVREIYVFDSWFHLNKMEQVLGRGIRTCSHSLLPKDERNCTIYLLVNSFGEEQDTETADLYMYRNAMTKAIQVGRVTRVLKRYALDCNLNREAIIVAGLGTQEHTDSQGEVREEVDINDTPFTNVCDWIETCEYTCAKEVPIKEDGLDVTTYDDFAVRWRESELKTAIKKLFADNEQPVFQLPDILEMMTAVPPKAISGLLADIVGNQSFRLKVGKTEGYIVYRNGYYMFQPDFLSDIRIPLALRVAEVPVKRDAFEPADIKAKPVAQAAPAAAQGEEAAAQAPTEGGTLEGFWRAIKGWAGAIVSGTADVDDIPAAVKAAIGARYVGDEQLRERERLIMINWLYEHIHTSKVYTGEHKKAYTLALAETLLQFVWDESLRQNEQVQLFRGGDESIKKIAKEQIVVKGETEAFRFVDPVTGGMRYICSDGPCSEAVARVFEADASDLLNGLKADMSTTGGIYGFLVPKAKEGRLVFKTSEHPAPVGDKPEKGGECAIVSTISFHIKMLKGIADNLVAEGYPKFILIDDILDEKARKKKEAADAKAAGTKSMVATKNPRRNFENAIRACSLKDIMLRWMDIMQRKKEGAAKRYFYRPVAALKTGHKGTVVKG